jgi:Zn-dependent oligopeptidase
MRARLKVLSDELTEQEQSAYRRTVLEPGGSVSANELVENFLGRPQSTEALRRWMAVEFDPEPH